MFFPMINSMMSGCAFARRRAQLERNQFRPGADRPKLPGHDRVHRGVALFCQPSVGGAPGAAHHPEEHRPRADLAAGHVPGAGRRERRARVSKKSGDVFRVGIFLDFVRLTTHTPHGAHVRRAKRNRIDPRSRTSHRSPSGTARWSEGSCRTARSAASSTRPRQPARSTLPRSLRR